MALILQIVFLHLWPFIIILAAPLVLAPTWIRVALFFVGPIFGLLIQWMGNLGSPDSPLLILPLVGLCVSVAAVLAEGLARIPDLLSKRTARSRRN